MTLWQMLDNDTLWTIALGATASASCALVGCYLVLQRLSLLGDAISHAILPGLVIGFLVSGNRSPMPMLIGAILAGILTTFLTQKLKSGAKVDGDAGMGTVFTTLFALGVLLLHKFAHQVDLDPDCVLHGVLGTQALSRQEIAGWSIPTAFPQLAGLLMVNIVVISMLWKEFKITSFDPALATTLGLSATVLHYLLMTMVSCTAVLSFESVGSILVIAMFIVPGATAQLLTDRLSTMLWLSVLIALLAAVGGEFLALSIDGNEASSMTVVLGIIFFLTVILAPRHGVIAKAIHRWLLSLRIVAEDVLARIYRHEETQNQQPLLQQPLLGLTAIGLKELGREGAIRGNTFSRWLAILALKHRKLLSLSGSGYILTQRGLDRAEDLVRSHRAWEIYLKEDVGIAIDHLHEPAHRMEHFVDQDLTAEILKQHDDPTADPHGRQIPKKPRE